MRAALWLGVVLALGAGNARAQEEPRTLVSFDFVLYYWPQHQGLVETVAGAAREALPRLQEALGLKSAGRITIRLAHTEQEFRELTGGSDPARILGQAFPERRVVVLQPLSGEALRELTVHELTHILLDDAVRATGAEIPRWLHEGLAQYAAGELGPQDRMLLTDAVNQGELMPLEELEQAFEGPPEKVSLAYTEAHTLVDYLAGLKPEVGLRPFLEQLGQVGDVSRALVRAYGLTPQALAEAWQKQITQQYVGRSNEESVTPLVWAGMVVLFAAAVLVRLRIAAGIRRRMEEEERRMGMWPPAPPGSYR